MNSVWSSKINFTAKLFALFDREMESSEIYRTVLGSNLINQKN